MNQTLDPTRLAEYITSVLPWAHGNQVNAITTFVAAILEAQGGCQAQLPRSQGNQEAATKRITRLLDNERLDPIKLAQYMLRQAPSRLPARGRAKLALAWTNKDARHLNRPGFAGDSKS